MKDMTTTPTRRPRRLRSAAPLVLSALALFGTTTGIATALPGQSTVNSGDIVDNTVKSKDLKDGKAVKSADVVDESLSSNDLATGSVSSAEISPSAVNASELGDGIHTHSGSAIVNGGVAQNGNYNVNSATATCGANEELISGSAHWTNEAPSDELFISEVTLNHTGESVTVKGGNDAGANRTLVAVASCLSSN